MKNESPNAPFAHVLCSRVTAVTIKLLLLCAFKASCSISSSQSLDY